MSVANYINKKAKLKKYKEAKEAHSNNPIFTKNVNCFGCMYCTSKIGRKKKYKNLWCLYMHFTREHKYENYKEFSMNLAELIIKGTIL